MESLIKDGVKYLIHNFQLENEFEKIVLRQSKLLFGENSIVFEKQKIRTPPGMGAIPDALIINPTTNKWFVIEIELAIHNVYHHIIPQITKFKNALENEQTRKSLLKYFDSEIENDLNKLATWYSSTQSKSPHKHLSEIIDKEPELIIIIDGQNKELEIASKNLPFHTKINVFKTYTREGVGLGDSIYSFDLYTEPPRSNFAAIKEKAIKAEKPANVSWPKGFAKGDILSFTDRKGEKRTGIITRYFWHKQSSKFWFVIDVDGQNHYKHPEDVIKK